MKAICAWCREELERSLDARDAGEAPAMTGGAPVLPMKDSHGICRPCSQGLLLDEGLWVCRGCGCTELNACEGGCGWVAPNLCSACAPTAIRTEGNEGNEVFEAVEALLL